MLLKIAKKILNLTKNKPTGGNPVKEKNNQKYKVLRFLYFCKNTIKFPKDKIPNILKSVLLKINANMLKRINM